MSTESALTPTAADPPTPLALIQQALAQGITPDQLGALMTLQERWEQSRAAERFAAAITSFQAECPTVFKWRVADAGKYKYKFASYDDVMRQSGPILAKYGIVVTFTSPERQEKGIKLRVRVRVGTHVEETDFAVPVPEMVVNDTQRYGAALSYAKRYAFCAALNVVVTDEDNDATALYESVNVEQVKLLKELIADKQVNLQKFLAWAEVESLDKVALRDLPKALDYLNRVPSPKPGGSKK